MASRKKKRRFLSLGFITKAMVSLGLIGGGGYAVTQSPWSSKLGMTAKDPTQEELKETHGDKLIAEMTAPRQQQGDPPVEPVTTTQPDQSNPKQVSSFSLASHSHKPESPTGGFQNPEPSQAASKPPIASFSPTARKSPGLLESALQGNTTSLPKPDTNFNPLPVSKPPVQPPKIAVSQPAAAPEKNQVPPTSPGMFQPLVKPAVQPVNIQPLVNSKPASSPAIVNISQPNPAKTDTLMEQPRRALKNVTDNLSSVTGTNAITTPPGGSQDFRKPVPKMPATQQPAVQNPPAPVVSTPTDPRTNNAFNSVGAEVQKLSNAAKGVDPRSIKVPPTKIPALGKSAPTSPNHQNTFDQRRLQANTFPRTTQGNALSPQTSPANSHARRIGDKPLGQSGVANQPKATAAGARLQIPAMFASSSPVATQSPNATRASTGAALRQFEGVQTPTLSLEKSAPREIQVGRPATFRLIVKNNGRVPAYGVTVVDEVPRGTQLKLTKPNPTSQNGNRMSWNLGTLQPGDISEIMMELIPTTQGEIGSVAQISFQSQASVRTVCTKPKLEIQHSTVNKALIGDDVVVKINVRNSGDGAATGVTLEEIIPANLIHAESNGRKLQYPLGTLAPGESRNLSLRLKAIKVGSVRNVISAKGDGGLTAQDGLNLEVVAPDLQLAAKGPTKRYLERQATYNVSVANRGTAPATNVRLIAKLPRGMKFIQTDKNGQYDPRSHAVYWSLLQLPTGSEGRVQLTLLPIDVGQQKIEYVTEADLNMRKTEEVLVAVEQYSELVFDIDDVADPIEVGTDTVYNIRVVNQGSKPATNVRVSVQMPDALKAISAQGPTQHQLGPASIQFAPIDRLAPNAAAKFTVQVKGQREGDHRVQVKLSSDERKEVVAKEESTKVYSDYR